MKASEKNIKLYAHQLFGSDYTKEGVEELIQLCTTPIEYRRGEHPSHAVAKRMRMIDEVLHNYGVEFIHYPEIMYSNTGDTYAYTILHYKGKFLISSWGSIVEQHQKRRII